MSSERRRRETKGFAAARLGIAAALCACAALACNDVGDSYAGPYQPSAGDDGALANVADDASEDATTRGGSASGSEEGGAAVSTPPASDDATAPIGSSSPGPDATVTADAAPDDAGGADVVGSDEDTGAPDATIADGAPPDTGSAPDTGVDATVPDASHDAASVVDSGGGTTPDAASPLTACTTAGQTHCVQCQFNNGAGGSLPNTTQLCTSTEAALVAHDIASGQAFAPGSDPDGGCYQCAALSGCLDDSEFADTDHECEDLSGATSQAQCKATLECILGSVCGADSISTCYCGSAPVSGTCASVGASNAANGACAAAEATGLGLAENDGLDILKSFTSTTLPSGVANNIFQCAASNDCNACLH